MFGVPCVVLGIKMGSSCVSVFTPVLSLSLSECLSVFLSFSHPRFMAHVESNLSCAILSPLACYALGTWG